MTEVALTRSRSPEEYREVIESTIAECQHLGHIVDNLLFLARTEAAEGHLQRTTFEGRAAIEKIAAFYEDPVKRAYDAHSAHKAFFLRSLMIEINDPESHAAITRLLADAGFDERPRAHRLRRQPHPRHRLSS